MRVGGGIELIQIIDGKIVVIVVIVIVVKGHHRQQNLHQSSDGF